MIGREARGGVNVGTGELERAEEQEDRQEMEKKFRGVGGGAKSIAAEPMSNRAPVGLGPSGQTWSRCDWNLKKRSPVVSKRFGQPAGSAAGGVTGSVTMAATCIAASVVRVVR